MVIKKNRSEDGDYLDNVEEVIDTPLDERTITSDNLEYMLDVVDEVSKKISEYFENILYDMDNNNIYFIVSKDDDVVEYSVPMEDLEYDTDTDVEYIIDSILEDDVIEDVEASYNAMTTEKEFMDPQYDRGPVYWYFTTHGVQPGSVPKGLNIYDVIDTPNGVYFLTDKVILTPALEYYDIKERMLPKDVEEKYYGKGGTPKYEKDEYGWSRVRDY